MYQARKLHARTGCGQPKLDLVCSSSHPGWAPQQRTDAPRQWTLLEQSNTCTTFYWEYFNVHISPSKIILRPVAWRRRSIGKHLREKRLLKFKNHENHLVLKRHLAGLGSQINESHLRIFHLAVRPVLLLLGCLSILFSISLRSVLKPEILVVAGQMIGDSSDI